MKKTLGILFFLLYTAVCHAVEEKVTVVFTGQFTQQQKVILKQQMFNKLSPQSLGFLSSQYNGDPFTVSLSSDHTQLTLTFIGEH